MSEIPSVLSAYKRQEDLLRQYMDLCKNSTCSSLKGRSPAEPLSYQEMENLRRYNERVTQLHSPPDSSEFVVSATTDGSNIPMTTPYATSAGTEEFFYKPEEPTSVRPPQITYYPNRVIYYPTGIGTGAVTHPANPITIPRGQYGIPIVNEERVNELLRLTEKAITPALQPQKADKKNKGRKVDFDL